MKKLVFFIISLVVLVLAGLYFLPLKPNWVNSPSLENYDPGTPKSAPVVAQRQASTASTSCLSASRYSLPVKQKHNSDNIKFEVASCEIIHAEDFICTDEKLRHISLPKFNDFEVILIPADCGDFSYRYYLATVKGNTLLDSLYVEGEWYEPENKDATLELSEFEVSQDYLISVKTQPGSTANSGLVLKNYRIDANGKFIEQTAN